MTIADVVLRHSQRGMNLLKELLSDNMYEEAAEKLLQRKKGTILLATGFYVAGFAETDGPPGTFFLAKALKQLGFSPVVITDSYCKNFFPGEEIPVCILEKGFSPADVLEQYQPVSLISIERCGRNIQGDYANCRGVSIADHTVEIDRIFDLAKERGLYTVGIGDGGNEIGMGNLKDAISERLSLVPCKTEVSDLLIATVSNWGAYGLCAALSILSKTNLLADYAEINAYIAYIVSQGSVDGIQKAHVPTVDGFAQEVEQEMVQALKACITATI